MPEPAKPVKMRITVTAEYDADPAHYANTNGAPDAMAAADRADLLAGDVSYDDFLDRDSVIRVEIVPVVSFEQAVRDAVDAAKGKS